ncbi:MAG: hypothetical protein NTX12_03070 [Actinobacteria bacterium]|nr:hypothetical protein [Actinomycetota bacterium]
MNTLAHLIPRLKTGITILPLPSRTFVGNAQRGLEIFSPVRAALPSIDGVKSCLEIGNTLNIPLEEIEELITQLDQAHLLDTSVGKLSVHSRFHSSSAHRASHVVDDSHDGAYLQMQSKIASELSFTTWHDGVRDGGVDAISERRNVSVAIHGDSRIATLLFGILLSSGLSQTTLHASEKRIIGEEDTCAGFLRPGDIGAPLIGRTQELARELSLFPPHLPSPPTKSKAKSKAKARSRHNEKKQEQSGQNEEELGTSLRSIAIAIGEAPADLIQGWLSKGVPHLLIDAPDGASLIIGPLVIPGKTPCARCIALTREEQSEIWSGVDWQRNISPNAEVPVAVAHHVAGLIALELLRFVDTGDSEVIGARVRFNYHAPLQGGRTIYARHPACGCSW